MTVSTTLATEEAEHGVRVNLLAPSLVDSPLAEAVLPWSRPLSCDEVAYGGDVLVEEPTELRDAIVDTCIERLTPMSRLTPSISGPLSPASATTTRGCVQRAGG